MGSEYGMAGEPQAVEHFCDDPRWRLVTSGIWIAFVFLLLLVVVVIGVTSAERFLHGRSVEDLLRRWATLLILAAPMVIIIASGGVDLSVGAMMGLSAVVIGSLARTAGIEVAFLVGMLAALVAGLLNGLLIALVRVHPVIATLGMALFLRSLAGMITGYQTIYIGPSWLGGLSDPLPSCLVGVALAAGCACLVYLTRFGRQASSHRSLGARCLFVGVPYAISGLAAGICGAMMVGMIQSADPHVGTGREAEAVLVVVLGGTAWGWGAGNPIGAALAALVLAGAGHVMLIAGVHYEAQTLVVGGGLLFFGFLCTLYHHVCDWIYKARVVVTARDISPQAPPV